MYKAGSKMEEAVNKTTNKKETIDEVLKYPIKAIPDRKIDLKTAEHFGVRTAVSETDGKTPIAIYFPYTDKGEIVGFKKRDLTKSKKDKWHFSTVGRVDAECDLFGMNAAKTTGGKKIWITEGEFDALICWQSLKEKETRGNPNVLSIGLGTANALKHIAHKTNLSYIKKHAEVIIAFDNDTVTPEEKSKGIKRGKEATKDVHDLIPEIFIAPLLDGYDPCDMYLREGSEQLFWALMKPIPYTPEGFVTFRDIREEAIKMPELGRPWPWNSLTKKTLGRRDGEGYFIGAGVKMGKSTFVDMLSQHVICNEKYIYSNGKEYPRKIALFKFEEQPAETLKKAAGKMYKKDFSNPEKILFIDQEGKEHDVWGKDIPEQLKYTFFTQDELINAVDNIGDNIVLYNNYGRCEWDDLKGAIRHAVLVEHVKDIVIDPITRLTSGLSAADTNTELERFADEISKMAKDLGFTYYCFCHLKAPEYGQPHEEGGRVKSAQFAGSRAMMRSCYYMIGIEGNKSPDVCERVQNTRYLVILEDRKFGRTGRIPLFYDKDTGQFIEPPEGFIDQDDKDETTCQTLAEWHEKYPNGFNSEDF